jgi:hypothetical protein
MIEFTVLSFGLCAVLFQHSQDEVIGIGNLRLGGDNCEIFYLAAATDHTISLQGHAVDIDRWSDGMAVTVDGKRFFVRRGEAA